MRTHSHPSHTLIHLPLNLPLQSKTLLLLLIKCNRPPLLSRSTIGFLHNLSQLLLLVKAPTALHTLAIRPQHPHPNPTIFEMNISSRRRSGKRKVPMLPFHLPHRSFQRLLLRTKALLRPAVPPGIAHTPEPVRRGGGKAARPLKPAQLGSILSRSTLGIIALRMPIPALSQSNSSKEASLKPPPRHKCKSLP